MFFANQPIEPVRQSRVEEHLDQDRHSQQRDDQRLLEDGLALKREQEDERRQQGGDRPGADFFHRRIESRFPPGQQVTTPDLGQDNRNHDVQHDRGDQRIPGHGDGRNAEQKSHQRREGHNHDAVVERNLRQGKQRIAVGQPAPHKDHCRARGGCQQDQPGDVAIELVGGQHRCKQVTNEQPAQKRHRERFDQPVDEQGDANPANVLAHFVQRAEIHLDQHRDDHHPDQQTDRQIDLGDLHATNSLKDGWEKLAQGNANDDAQENPDAQIALKNTHR